MILRDSAGFNVSGGRTRHRGLEYEGDWSFAEDWAISAAGTLARHEYRFTAAVEQGEQITTGNDIDTAPRDIHALRLRRGRGRSRRELEWQQVGPYWTNAANTARYGGHELVNLRLSGEPQDDWSLALRVTNLLDAAYADRADFAFGDYRYFPGRGRAYLRRTGLAQGLSDAIRRDVLTALVGATLAVQVGLNATMSRHVGSPMAAALINFGVGTFVLFADRAASARGSLPMLAPGGRRAVVGLGRGHPRRRSTSRRRRLSGR